MVALSGIATPSVVDRFHAGNRRRIPIFLAYGEDDLDYLVSGVPKMVAQLEAAGHPHHWCRLPGQTHFYLAETAAVCSVGSPANLEAAIEAFVEGALT